MPQDSSSLIVAFSLLTKNEKRNVNENKTTLKRKTKLRIQETLPTPPLYHIKGDAESLKKITEAFSSLGVNAKLEAVACNYIWEKKKQSREVVIPEDYICPISKELFVNPHVAADGHSYEKVEIDRWFESHPPSELRPTRIKGDPIKSSILIPNHQLRAQCIAFREDHNLPIPVITHAATTPAPGQAPAPTSSVYQGPPLPPPLPPPMTKMVAWRLNSITEIVKHVSWLRLLILLPGKQVLKTLDDGLGQLRLSYHDDTQRLRIKKKYINFHTKLTNVQME